jgi:hypothetical protein
MEKITSRMQTAIRANDFHKIIAIFLVERCTEGIGT